LAPGHLSAQAAALYAGVLSTRTHLSAAQAALLVVAFEAFDRAEAAREQLGREGMVVEPRAGAKMIHAHPLVKIEAAARSEFIRLWQLLGLHRVPSPAPRIEFLGGPSSKW